MMHGLREIGKVLIGIFLIGMCAEGWANGSMTVYSYPPYRPLNWSTPKKLLKGFLSTEVHQVMAGGDRIRYRSDYGDDLTFSSQYTSTMGHTLIHYECALPTGEKVNRWVGFSGEDYGEVNKRILLKDQLGMGVIFYNFIDGHIVRGMKNILSLIFYKSTKYPMPDGTEAIAKPRYIRFGLGSSACADIHHMTHFFETFRFKPGTPYAQLAARKPEDTLFYNLNYDPYESYLRRMETGQGLVGGGCAPYVAAMVKRAGLYEPLFDKAWKIPISVSHRLIGSSSSDPNGVNGPVPKKVSPWSILFGDLGKHWHHQGFSNREISAYDPMKIWEFTGAVHYCLQSPKNLARSGCTSAARAWIAQHGNRLSVGKSERFSHEYSRLVTPIGSGHASPYYETVRAEVSIPGVVLSD